MHKMLLVNHSITNIITNKPQQIIKTGIPTAKNNIVAIICQSVNETTPPIVMFSQGIIVVINA